jgi:hypothetical protein
MALAVVAFWAGACRTQLSGRMVWIDQVRLQKG